MAVVPPLHPAPGPPSPPSSESGGRAGGRPDALGPWSQPGWVESFFSPPGCVSLDQRLTLSEPPGPHL